MVAITRTQTIFNINPTRTISLCFTSPVPKTMAFGGVATGSMKAQEAPKPMIKARPISGIPNDCAMEIKIGTNKAALAVLDVNSVKKIMKATTNKPMR